MSTTVLVPIRCFTASHVKTYKRSGYCKCGNIARPGQGNCLACNAEASRKFRRRQAEKKAEHRQQIVSALNALAQELSATHHSERTGTGT